MFLGLLALVWCWLGLLDPISGLVEEEGVCVSSEAELRIGQDSLFPTGDFESHLPIYQSVLKSPFMYPSFFPGQICNDASDAVEDKLFDYMYGLWNTTLAKERCRNAFEAYGNKKLGNAFSMASALKFDVHESYVVQYVGVLFDVYPDTDHAYMRFQVAVPEQDLGISDLSVFEVAVVGYLDDTEDPPRMLLKSLNLSALANLPDCPLTGRWRRFTFSLEPVLQAFDHYEKGNCTTNFCLSPRKQIQFALTMPFLFQSDIKNVTTSALVGVDNIEFLGTLESPGTTYNDRYVTIPQLEFPVYDASVDIPMIVTVSLTGVAVLSAIITTLCVAREDALKQREILAYISLMWVLLSMVMLGFAFRDYFSFKETMSDLERQTRELTSQMPFVLQKLNPSEFKRKIIGGVPFGSFNLGLPPLSRQELEAIFDFTVDPEKQTAFESRMQFCSQTTISLGNSRNFSCVTDVEEFFANYSSPSQVFSVSLRGEVGLSQEIFVDLLFASLMMDLVIGLAQILVMALFVCAKKIESMNTIFHRINWFYVRLDLLVVLAGFALTVTIIIRVVNVPIVYDPHLGLMLAPMSLTDIKQEVRGIYVAPKNPQIRSDGSLFIDTGALFQNTTKCYDDVGLRYGEILNSIFTTKSEEFFEVGRTKEQQVCDFSKIDYDDVNNCLSFDCTNGILPMVTAEAAKEQIDFLYQNVIYNIVVIDAVISCTDLFFLFIVFRISYVRSRGNTSINDLEDSKDLPPPRNHDNRKSVAELFTLHVHNSDFDTHK